MTEAATLTLRTAIGPYGHHRALKDGSVGLAGAAFDHVEIDPITTALRLMCRNLEFDVSEMAITTYVTAKTYGKPFTAIPVFPLRNFPHETLLVNADAGIASPKDLEGKRVGVRAYTVTTGVWARGILADDFGLDTDKVTWVLGDEEHVAEFHADAPANAEYRAGADLGAMLASGELAATFGLPVAAPNVKPLLPDPAAAARDFYARRGIYPLNHTVVIKDSVLAEHPWLAPALFEAFKLGKERWLQSAGEADRLALTGGVVTGDPLPLGVEANRRSLETVLRYAHEQKIVRRFDVDELFPASVRELS